MSSQKDKELDTCKKLLFRANPQCTNALDNALKSIWVPGSKDVAKVCGAANDIDMYINALQNQKRHHNIGSACQRLALEFACGDFRDPLRDLDKASPKTYSQMTGEERAQEQKRLNGNDTMNNMGGSSRKNGRSFLQRVRKISKEEQDMSGKKEILSEITDKKNIPKKESSALSVVEDSFLSKKQNKKEQINPIASKPKENEWQEVKAISGSSNNNIDKSNINKNETSVSSKTFDLESKIPCYCTILEICDSMALVPVSAFKQRSTKSKEKGSKN